MLAHLTGPDWIDKLPWVFLGIRTVPNKDLGCSSSEMVYAVPGDLIASNSTSFLLQNLRDPVRPLAPVFTYQYGTALVSVPADLQHAKFVFIRCGSHRTPLQRHYKGPFKLIESGPIRSILGASRRSSLLTG